MIDVCSKSHDFSYFFALQLNEYGQPPAGLIGGDQAAAGGIPEFDPSQFSDPSQCCLM